MTWEEWVREYVAKRDASLMRRLGQKLGLARRQAVVETLTKLQEKITNARNGNAGENKQPAEK